MSDSDTDRPGGSSETFLAELQQSGFFDQIGQLESALGRVSDDLMELGQAATRRLEETESLATHVLAMESILVALLRQVPVSSEAVAEAVTEKTGSGDDSAAPVVGQVAHEILTRAGLGGED